MRMINIGRCNAALYVGDGNDWAVGVSYQTAVLFVGKRRDGTWHKAWLRHRNCSNTTTRHSQRLISAAAEELGSIVYSCSTCDTSAFRRESGRWRELGLYGDCIKDVLFIESAYQNDRGELCNGGW